MDWNNIPCLNCCIPKTFEKYAIEDIYEKIRGLIENVVKNSGTSCKMGLGAYHLKMGLFLHKNYSSTFFRYPMYHSRINIRLSVYFNPSEPFARPLRTIATMK